MQLAAGTLPSCPNCAGHDVYTEPELDEDEAPTGNLIAICAGCGRSLATLPDTEASPEGEPWYAGEMLLPVSEDVDMEPRGSIDWTED